MAAHFHHKHRQCQRGSDPQFALEMLAFFGMALGGAACGGWRIGLQQLCRIASLAHCGEQTRYIHSIHHLHRGALCCQIHGGVQHTGLLSEDALHTPHTGGTGHLLHLQLQAVLRHAVACFFNGGDGGGHIRCASKVDARLLGGQIDAGILHTGQFFEHTLHTPHARGTAHTLYGQIYLKGGRRGCSSHSATVSASPVA